MQKKERRENKNLDWRIHENFMLRWKFERLSNCVHVPVFSRSAQIKWKRLQISKSHSNQCLPQSTHPLVLSSLDLDTWKAIYMDMHNSISCKEIIKKLYWCFLIESNRGKTLTYIPFWVQCCTQCMQNDFYVQLNAKLNLSDIFAFDTCSRWIGSTEFSWSNRWQTMNMQYMLNWAGCRLNYVSRSIKKTDDFDLSFREIRFCMIPQLHHNWRSAFLFGISYDVLYCEIQFAGVLIYAKIDKHIFVAELDRKNSKISLFFVSCRRRRRKKRFNLLNCNIFPFSHNMKVCMSGNI